MDEWVQNKIRMENCKALNELNRDGNLSSGEPPTIVIIYYYTGNKGSGRS